jgi:5'-nucleotidase
LIIIDLIIAKSAIIYKMKGLKKPTVLIDMDGPLAGFDAEILSRLKTQYPKIPLLTTRNNSYISDDYPEHSLLVRSISDEKGFFESLPLIDNALEGWQKVIDLGYHPRICSSPLGSNPFSTAEKLEWIRKNLVPVFGQYVLDEAIITTDKYKSVGIVLIDDSPELKNYKQAVWQHIVFDEPYNQDSKQPRLYGWLDKNLPNLLNNSK